MKLPVSTEWLLHCAATLAQLDPSSTASAAQLARYYDLPAPYLAKQLQALVKAGVLVATTGPTGGFRLAQPASEITLLRIVEAVDGSSPPYTCREIRQQGQGALPADECQSRCVLAEKMAEAHEAWRRSLAGVSLADIIATLPPVAPARTRSRLTSTGSADPTHPAPCSPSAPTATPSSPDPPPPAAPETPPSGPGPVPPPIGYHVDDQTDSRTQPHRTQVHHPTRRPVTPGAARHDDLPGSAWSTH
nr:Rrf2 family transcriptional regulator [Salinispora tropica]